MTVRKAIGLAVFIAAGVTTGVALSKHPWDIFREQQDAASVKRQEMVQSEQRREELLRLEAEVRSSVGRERLARKAGFVKPGEVPADGG